MAHPAPGRGARELKWERALEKASAQYKQIERVYDAEHHWWLVKSSSGEGWYAVFRYQWQPSEPPPFWREWGCTCPAQNHPLPICYHKALVYLLLQEGELGEVA